MNMLLRLTNSHGSWSSAQTGKGFFVSRLIPALQEIGVEVTQSLDKQVDIDMHIGKFVYKPKNCKKVILRLGPAHVDKNQDYKKLNERKAEALKKCDAVIYQSEFGKKMCDAFLGKKERWAIIGNGARSSDYLDVKKAHSLFRKNILASTRTWTKQKRLKEIIKSFKLACIGDCCLWIAGDAKGLEKKYDDDSIKFLGSIDQRRLSRYYRMCDVMVSIVYLDCCPNAVAEAICAGLPVITTDFGGTHEMVRGVMSTIKDTPWDFKAIDLNKPPKINRFELADTMRYCTNSKMSVDTRPVDIRNIAQQYKAFFEEVLDG